MRRGFTNKISRILTNSYNAFDEVTNKCHLFFRHDFERLYEYNIIQIVP